jgi:ABC-2 type transport system ATP-binding protein
MIVGILASDAGTVTVDGKTVTTKTPDAKSAIGFVPQDLAIYPDLSARENLRFFGKLQDLRGPTLASRVDDVLEVIGLSDRAEDRSDTFSGGMKRRLNIGIGMLHKPRLLILDEPTVGVDPQSRNAILESIEALSAAGMAVLYTTHYMEEAERLCDRVGIIDGGELKAEGTRRELVALVGERDRIRFSVSGNAAVGAYAARTVDGVDKVVATAESIEVMATDARGRLAAVLASITDAGVVVTGVDVTEPDLEAVFLHLTGKALRD